MKMNRETEKMNMNREERGEPHTYTRNQLKHSHIVAPRGRMLLLRKRETK